MNSTTVLYDNLSIEHASGIYNVTNPPPENTYLFSSTRFVVFTIARWCQVIVGVPANILTLLIIKRLRIRLNMHIIMVYMAVSDISSSATLPMGICIHGSTDQIINFKDLWNTFCIIKVYFDMNVVNGSMLSYYMLSLDR